MERSFYLAFSNFSGIGPHKFASLIRTFGSAKKAYGEPVSSLSKVIGKKTSEKFEDFRSKFDIGKYEKELKQKKIDYICLIDEEYPSLLKQIPNPPILLYVKGDWQSVYGLRTTVAASQKAECPTIAIVGTRKMTSYGQEVTAKFATELVQAGFVIVSGMALGVDGQAHKSCLENNGKTIAVLGNGVDLPFPPSNKYLYDRIVAGGGVMISELPPGEPPSKGSFPSRNRIIAGLSQAVLVTQGAADSGSVITANFAIKFGRPVFAVPGPITSSLSKGPNDLISKGAKIVFDATDILKSLGISSAKLKAQSSKRKGLTKEEEKIIKFLDREELSLDQIIQVLGLKPSEAAVTLSLLEIKGLVKTSPEGLYSTV